MEKLVICGKQIFNLAMYRNMNFNGTMMKQLVLLIGMLCTLVACSSSDDIPAPEPESPSGFGYKSGVEYDLTFNLSADTACFNKNVDNHTRAPHLPVVYLMVENSQDYLELNVTKEQTSKDMDFNGSVRLTVVHGDKGDVYLKNASKTLNVTKKNWFLSSTPNLTVTMEGPSTETLSGKPVYRPYGDKIFCSHPYSLKYGKIYPKWGSPFEGYQINLHNGDASTYFVSNAVKKGTEEVRFDDLVFDLERLTISIVANFAMVDWEEKFLVGEVLKEVDSKAFADSLLGSKVEDWSVRTYIDNAPSQLTITRDINNMVVPTGEILISLKDQATLLGEVDVLREDANVDSHNIWGGTITGIGRFYDKVTDEVFIFPMQNNESSVLYAFYCSKPETSYLTNKRPKKRIEKHYYAYKRLRVPFSKLNVSSLTPGTRYELLTIITISDFKRAMDKDLGFGSRTSAPYSPEFSEVMDIPYKVILRKLDDQPSEK